VQVSIEGTPAPLLYVSSAQINAVAPYLLDGRTAAHIQIVTANATSNAAVLGVRQSMPEIFLSPSGSENPFLNAAILNQDGTVNGQTNPAHVGDTVAMFVSGVGQITPPGVDGAIPTAAGGTPVLPVIVQVANTANVTYVGNAPGLISGVAQVNFQIPQFNPVVGAVPPYPIAGPPYPIEIVLSVGEMSTASAGFAPVVWVQ
jgi:uncharacterized protein (TIGR03437 family)